MVKVSEFIGKTVTDIKFDGNSWFVKFDSGESIFFQFKNDKGPFFDKDGEKTENDIPTCSWIELFHALPGRNEI